MVGELEVEYPVDFESNSSSMPEKGGGIDACGFSIGARQDEQLDQGMCSNFTTLFTSLPRVRRWLIYHRRPMICCIWGGDTEGGGLDIVMPVVGLIMGMALPRLRVAAG